jgi:putative FmdB family regulatory protein
VPLYDYDCAACGRRFEVIHGVHDGPPEQCPLCGSGPVRKAIAAPAIHFKGSGWAKKERRAAVKSTSSGDGDASSGDRDKDSGDRDKDSGGEGSSKTPEKTSTSTTSSSSGESGSTSSPASTSSGSSD